MTSSLQLGISAAKAGRMQEALTNLKDAIIEEPHNADVWVWIAAIIDDADKQTVFLEKAIDLDPHNVPAQRGLAYLEMRKRENKNRHDDHLSDHTQPISPFPAGKRPNQTESPNHWQKISEGLLDELADSAEQPENINLPLSNKEGKTPIKLTPFEMSLLGIVALVFAFIGLLASSALFNFELPLHIFNKELTPQVNIPPSSGVFLYEHEDFFSLEQHVGLPNQDVGIPTTTQTLPKFIFYQSAAEVDRLTLIHETGEIFPLNIDYEENGAVTITPKNDLDPGLFCFEQPSIEDLNQTDPFYWCFHVYFDQLTQ